MRLYLTMPSLKYEKNVWNLVDEYNRYESEIDGIILRHCLNDNLLKASERK